MTTAKRTTADLKARKIANAPAGAKPKAELKIVETRVYRGPNYWNYDPAIKLIVDLGVLEHFPSNTIPGFVEALLEMLPGVGQHSCGTGKVGRVRASAARGHLGRARRRAHRPPAAARGRHRGRSRQDPRHRRAGPLPRRLLVRRGVGRRRRRQAGRPPRQPPRGGGEGLRLRRRARAAHPPRRARRIRTIDPGDPRRGGAARHPVHPPQRAVARPARPRHPSEAHPRHDDQRDRLARRRHRVGQEAHEPPARGHRRPGPALGGRRAARTRRSRRPRRSDSRWR